MRLDRYERDALGAVRARVGAVEMLCHCTGELEWWDGETDIPGANRTATLVATPGELVLLAARFSSRSQRVVRVARVACVAVQAIGRSVIVDFADGGGVELVAGDSYAAGDFADRLSRSWPELDNPIVGSADDFALLDSLFGWDERHLNPLRVGPVTVAARPSAVAFRPRPHSYAGTHRRPLPYPSPAASGPSPAAWRAVRPRQGSNLRPTA